MKAIFIQMNTVPHSKYFLKMACLPLLADQVQCQPKTIEQIIQFFGFIHREQNGYI